MFQRVSEMDIMIRLRCNIVVWCALSVDVNRRCWSPASAAPAQLTSSRAASRRLIVQYSVSDRDDRHYWSAQINRREYPVPVAETPSICCVHRFQNTEQRTQLIPPVSASFTTVLFRELAVLPATWLPRATYSHSIQALGTRYRVPTGVRSSAGQVNAAAGYA